MRHTLLVDHLRDEAAGSYDRYVFLDAQDWMTRPQLEALWAEVTRTAAPGAKVIFRTAGPDSMLEENLPETLRSAWTYDAASSADFHRADRSAIYGGFHLYERRAP
jgi:S-adenosylmethionine-diacylglycerol 3-amino-3-carboxypropyl transferase